VKEFLSREGVPYIEKNVGVDRQAAAYMVQRTQQMGVPVTEIADEFIIGFNQQALKAAVTRWKQQPPSSNSGTGTGGLLKLGAQVADADGRGAKLGKVHEGSLAARAGLKEGDVITRLYEQNVRNADDLAVALKTVAGLKIFQPLVVFERNGVELETKLPT
jgi:S1-C subfamily serine protease